MCAGLDSGAQFLILWTKRDSIRLVRKDCTLPRGCGHGVECSGWVGLCFDTLGRGLSAFYEWQEGHTCCWLRKRLLAGLSDPFCSFWAHRWGSISQDPLLEGRATWLNCLQWNMSGNDVCQFQAWSVQTYPVCAASHALPFYQLATDRTRGLDFPDGSVVKNSPASAGDTSSIPAPGRFCMPLGH